MDSIPLTQECVSSNEKASTFTTEAKFSGQLERVGSGDRVLNASLLTLRSFSVSLFLSLSCAVCTYSVCLCVCSSTIYGTLISACEMQCT